MQKLTSEHLFHNYHPYDMPDEPPLRVEQGESFLIETVDTDDRRVFSEQDLKKQPGPMAGNPSTGPVYVDGIKAEDVIAVTIESLEVVGHTSIGCEGVEDWLLPGWAGKPQEYFVRIESGCAHFPGGIKVPVAPMFGCFGIVPTSERYEPFTHGGNLDIPDICAGNTIHVRCERDGGYFACGDGHAIQGDGEINSYSLEVSLVGRLRIEKSRLDPKCMVIETPDKLITVGVAGNVRGSVALATYSMADLLANSRGLDLSEASHMVSHVGDIRVGAVWPLWHGEHLIPVPFCLHLDRDYFNAEKE